MEQRQVTIEDVLADHILIDEFIQNQESFILRSASRASGRHISKKDDEWAIALEGFLKAVQRYDIERGGFYSFAERVIHNSLVDQFRVDRKNQAEGLTDCIEEYAPMVHTTEEFRRGVQQEIHELNETLASYGISFQELADCSPKAEKTKRNCGQAIRVLLQHKEWLDEMKVSKRLPIAKLQQHITIPRKILERHRKYIIAVTEILDGDYLYLAEYVKQFKEVER